MLYFPWREEIPDLLSEDQTYTSKFNDPNVQLIVENNRANFEPDAEAVEKALEFVRNNDLGNLYSYDVLNDQENADLDMECEDHDQHAEETFNEQPPEHLEYVQNQQQPPALVGHTQPSEIPEELLREYVRSLNYRQRCAYDTVLTWCRTKVMSLNTKQPKEIEPLYIFITGGAGTGKSHLIRSIFHTAVKTFRRGPANPEIPSVLLMAPTGVAAVNISGTTINTALAIPKEAGDNVPAMSDQKNS